jgi:hypothetical protein
VISHKWWKDREVLKTSDHIRGHFWHILFVYNFSLTNSNPWFSIFLVSNSILSRKS